MSLDCPKCRTSGSNLMWQREDTIRGPVAYIKCFACDWQSPVVVDGRKRLDAEPEEPKYGEFAHLSSKSSVSLNKIMQAIERAHAKAKSPVKIVYVPVYKEYVFSHKGLVMAFEGDDARIMAEFLEQGSKMPDFKFSSDVANVVNLFLKPKSKQKKEKP